MKTVNTNAFRMSIGFALVFIAILSAALISVFYITFIEIEEHTDHELLHELNELETDYTRNGLESVIQLVRQRDEYGRHLHHFYALFDSHSNQYYGNLMLIENVQAQPDFSPNMTPGDRPHHFYIDYREENVVRIGYKSIIPGIIIITGLAQQSTAELLEHIMYAVISTVLLTIVLSLLTGFYMGRRVLSSITQLDKELEAVIRSDFRGNLNVPEEKDEFYEVVIKLNQLITQVHSLFNGMKQVTDNVAHDLRSPLTRLRNKLEVTLLQARETNEYRRTMESAIEDCNEILQTFNALLSIARAEAGVRGQDWVTLSMKGLLDDLAEMYTAVAETRNIELNCQIDSDAQLTGNRQLLAQAVANLIENAIKFSPAGSAIQLSLETRRASLQIRVCDQGPGIAVQDRERVQERFQRLDSARSTPGSGLGLSLVKAVTQLHGGTLLLEDNHPGLCAILEFPC